MNKVIVLGLAMLFSLSLSAQKELPHSCGSEAPKDYVDNIYEGMYRNVPADKTERAIFYAPIKMTIFTKTDGTGAKNADDVYKLLCELNAEYSNRDVQFWLYEMPQTVPTTRYPIQNRNIDCTNLVQAHNEAYVVNVYYNDLDQISDPGSQLCGFSNFPGTGFQGTVQAGQNSLHNRGATFLNVKGQCTTPGASSTFIHELGHFFSLLHPFQGTSQNPSAVTSEYVTRGAGANCPTSGDGLCDTEADYIDFSSTNRWNNCAPAQSIMDFRGDVFKPDASLFMSYSGDNCQNKFTVQQGSQMAAALALPSNNTGSRRYLSFYPRPNQADIVQNVSLNYPANNQTNVVPNFMPLNWSAVPGATNYHLQISTTPNFDKSSFHKVFETITTINTYLYTDQLFTGFAPGTTVYWRVKPLNQVSYCRSFQRRQFKIGVPYPVSVENLTDSDIRLYPNLFTQGMQSVNVYSESVSLNNAEYRLMDLNGRVIAQKNLGNLEAGNYTNIELGSLNAGVYFIQIHDGSKTIKKKLIVQ